MSHSNRPGAARSAASTARERWYSDADRFLSVFTFASIGMAIVSLEGRFLEVNPAFCTLTGYSAEELLATDFQSLTHPDDLNADLALAASLVQGKMPSYQLEKRYSRRGGGWVWGLLSVSLIRDEGGLPLYFISQIQDISGRKRLEAEVRRSSEAMRSLVQNAPDVIGRFSTDHVVLFVNEAVLAVAGLPPEALLGRTLGEAGLPDEFVGPFESHLAAAASTGQVQTGDMPSSAGGRHIQARFVPEFDAKGQLLSVLVVAREITDLVRERSELERLEAELREQNGALALANARLQNMADHDVLTGIKNRRFFEERLVEAISRLERALGRGEHVSLSVSLIDVDHFKKINDTLGHAAGDQVLRTVAELIDRSFRPSDVVARFGGEEFAVILADADAEQAMRAVERCRRAAQAHDFGRIGVTVSAGIATWSGEDCQALVVRADLALYRAKHGGRNLVVHFASGGFQDW